MLVYIFAFIISVFYIYVGNRFVNKKNNILGYIFIILGLIIPCFLASLRGINVGTDTNGYIKNLYNDCFNYNNFVSYFNYVRRAYDIVDIGYVLITCISAYFFNSFQLLLFIIELLIIIPIYFSLKNNCSDNRKVLFGMVIFYLFFYNTTLNMARQSISLSFIILGFSFLKNKQKICSFICLIVASLFHITSLVTVFVYIAYYIFHKIKSLNVKKYIFGSIVLLTIATVFLFKYIIIILYNLNIYKHGLLYLEKFTNASFDFSFINTFSYLFFILILLFYRKKIANHDNNYYFYLFMMIESIIILQFGGFVNYLDRISYYFLFPIIFNVIPFVNYDELFYKIKNIKIHYDFIIFILLLFRWFYIYAILKLDGTIPYYFS